jgi:hypothetical protein
MDRFDSLAAILSFALLRVALLMVWGSLLASLEQRALNQ